MLSNKVAILIIGHIRTWLQCKDNFIESFGHLTPDIYISTYDLQYNYHPAQRHWMGNTDDTYLSKNQIVDMFSNLNVIDYDVENLNEVLAEFNETKHTYNLNFQSELHTILQYRKLNRVINAVIESEKLNNFKYDSIVKIRADIIHNKFEFNITNNNVIISSGNVYPNDVILALGRDNFIKMNEFIQTEIRTPAYNDSYLKAPHNLLLRSFEHIGVTVESYDIMRYVNRKSGKHYYNNIY